MADEIRDPFIEAHTLANSVVDSVKQNQTIMLARAETMRGQAEAVMAQMGEFKPDLDVRGGPTPPDFSPDGPRGEFNLPELSSSSFGAISPITRSDFNGGSVAPIDGIAIAPFGLSFEGIRVPDAPVPRDFGDGPTKPSFAPIVTPSLPVLNRPVLPALDAVVIPDFEFPTIPLFDESAPEFEGSFVSTVLQWTETPYEVEILDEVMAKLRDMWAGTTGLPPAVEQALWDRAYEREDVGINRDVSAALIEFSARGYTLPPGVLLGRIDSIRNEGALRKQTLGRDVYIKAMDVQVENMRFACTQAIAAEQVLISIWSAIAARAFDGAKIQLDAQLSLLNAHVAIFNARQSGYATAANVFKINVDARLSELQVMRMQLEAELSKGTLNEQKVRTYAEMTRALLADVEIYKSQMQGAQLQSELQRNQVEMFKAEVQAFAEQLQSDKNRFDVFESQVKGETAKAGLVESQARAYSAYVSGKAAEADVKIKNQQAQVAVLEYELRSYLGNLEKDKALLQSQLAGIQAAAEAHRTNTTRYTAVAQAEISAHEVQVRALEGQQRTAVAMYEVEVRKSIADMEQMIRVAGIQLEALKGAAQMSSTLAAGAMAGISISSNASGAGAITATGTRSDISDLRAQEF